MEKNILQRHKTSLSIPTASHRNDDRYVINHASHNDTKHEKMTPKKEKEKKIVLRDRCLQYLASILCMVTGKEYLPEDLRVDHRQNAGESGRQKLFASSSPAVYVQNEVFVCVAAVRGAGGGGGVICPA